MIKGPCGGRVREGSGASSVAPPLRFVGKLFVSETKGFLFLD